MLIFTFYAFFMLHAPIHLYIETLTVRKKIMKDFKNCIFNPIELLQLPHEERAGRDVPMAYLKMAFYMSDGDAFIISIHDLQDPLWSSPWNCKR